VAAIISGPSPLDWKVYAGDRNEVVFSFEAGGAPWDITGASVAAQARIRATDPAVALDANVDVFDATSGKVTIAWDGEEVRALLAGADHWQGVWDLQITETGETLPITMLRGKFTAIYDVTRLP